jgi:outer membrane protein insertion porin family
VSRGTHLALVIALCASPALAQKRPTVPAKKPAQAAKAADEKAQYPIAELVTSGSERYDADDILKYTGLKKDKTIETPLDDVKAAAQKLVDSGAFSQVDYKHTASTGGMKVEFIIGDKDDDQFVKCDFANIIWLPEDQLLIELHDRVPLFNGTVPRDGTLADNVAKALQALLKERGVNGNVGNEHVDAINGDPSTEAMTYSVVDVDIRIAKVELTGASPAMQAEADRISKQITGLVYNRATVKKFIEHNLKNAFLKQGYMRAAFAAPQIKVLPASGATTNIELSIPVTEGRTYKLYSVKWTGNKAISSAALDTFLHVPPDVPLDGTRLAKDIDAIRVKYASFGYLHMTLTPKPTFDEASGIMHYEMVVKEGDLFSMGKFDVEGLDKSSTEKMRLAWQLREGDPFDPTYVTTFLKKFRLPEGTGYLIDEAEGERPKSVDLTVLFCSPTDPCKPKNANQLYTPPAADDDK